MSVTETGDASGLKKILYLYCLAESKDLETISGTGIDDSYPLFLSRTNGVTAVLSHADPADFIGEKGEENLGDINWIGPRACRHQDVISRVMARSPVMPVRFGTLYLSQDSLNRMMATHQDDVAGFLKTIAGKEEWAVKGYMDRKKALKKILSSLADPASGANEPGDQPSPGIQYFQRKKQEQEAETSVNAFIHESAMAVADILEPLSIDINERELMSRTATGKSMDMVLNWAALLEKERVDQFNRRIEQINADHEKDGLVLEFSGPWPPYSFCPAIGKGKER